ncbi:ribonuclease H-like domain-containing protein [Zychaea mexicana]|uniref:ribonuclease H-like domain-containing protein n=1 Tax=Zychaea mexicana TaxID=64656 RepID=UPI0022FE6816|nr:ribonuclease H-like domain-containing protein [Zychaea mexicana]KAI9488498.1 ribonuclease H-like domain-containing protein [Zychaea mexicana]
MGVPATKHATVSEVVKLNTNATSQITFCRRRATDIRHLQTTAVAAGRPKGKKRDPQSDPSPSPRRRQIQRIDSHANSSATTAKTDGTIIAKERQEVEELEELKDQTITTAANGNDNEKSVPKTTKRKLPKTLLQLTPQTNDDQVFKPDLPNIKYPQHYTVSCSSDPFEMNTRLRTLLSKKEVVFGLDLEWQPQFKKGGPMHKTALIQICGSDTILLFQVARLETLPTELISFLKNENIFKAGVNIKGDGQKLFRDFNVCTNGLVELQLMTQHIDSPLLMRTHKRSLSVLTSLFLEMNMPKTKSVRLSNWSKANLTPKQMLYAACDAYDKIEQYQQLKLK